MSRFELYGSIRCEGCDWYESAETDPHDTSRCYYPDNIHTDWIGVCFHDKPDYINWNLKCKNYKPKENT